METTLSSEEFQRMQMQLLDLRSKNYTLGEKNVKIQAELLQNNKLLDDLRKELAKSQKIISRSKTAKEIELLVQENETMQQKLQMQEDEFRLQNETLLQEVSALVTSNDRITKELDLCKSGCLASSELKNQDDRIKLEAENAALKKLLAKYENRNDPNSNDAESELRKVDGELDLIIVLEEKRLLQANMKQIENEYKEQILKMQNENEKLFEKLKKKQESFLILQEEKEKLYTENKNALDSVQTSKDAEIQILKEKLQVMEIELRKAFQISQQLSGEEIGKDMTATVEFNGDKATFDCSLNEARTSFMYIPEKIQSLNNQLSEYRNKVEELESTNKEHLLEIQNLEKSAAEMEKTLTEKTELADKRKKMMDDMKAHLIETTNKQSIEIETLTQKLSNEKEAFQKLFDKEKETQVKLIEARNEVQSLKMDLEKLQLIRCELDGKVKELEAIIQDKTVEMSDRIAEKEKDHSGVMEELHQKFAADLQDLNIQVEVARAERAEFEEKVRTLQQEAKDAIDDRKIQEKKGLSMVKDLKRQLQVERNRAEKLQDRLQEVLNEQNRSVDDLLQSSSDKPKGDASSISSWSYVSGGTAEKESKDATLHSDSSSAGHDSPNRTSPFMLESETSNLLAKVTQLQQKNWTLEEKVNHLEMSNEALVDDVLKKTALIQFYCMEGRAEPHSSSAAQDKLTIKRIVDFIKDRGDENLREINRRMQRMLEETLTKNMHLQKDIETLSNEVSRLSKLAVAPINTEIQSAVLMNGV